MTKISAQVVADSATPYGERLTSLLVTMPRYILAEFNTHRMLSKNSASSRAIPFNKMVKSITENPFIPVAWMKDHSGMQGTEYFENEEDINWLSNQWKDARWEAIERAKKMNERGLTKQMCNRPLEAYMWHTVLVSGTEWENFFALRCPQYEFGNRIFRSRGDWYRFMESQSTNGFEGDSYPHEEESWWRKINKGKADIHMMLTAEAIWDAMNESTPKKLKAGEWHIPFGDTLDLDFLEGTDIPKYKVHTEKIPSGETVTHIPVEGFAVEKGYYEMRKVKIATARAAQTSYTVIGEDGKELDYNKLVALHDRLAKSGHWSCFEHCARVMSEEEYALMSKAVGTIERNKIDGVIKYSEFYERGWCGNYRGFIQYRKLFANENITK